MGTRNEIEFVDLSRSIEFVDLSTTEERVDPYAAYKEMTNKFIESMGVPSELYQDSSPSFDFNWMLFEIDRQRANLNAFQLPPWFIRELNGVSQAEPEKVNWQEDGF